ncbi:MAG TPA: hypothetical protein VF475_13465 [Sphingobium sp.]
MRINRTNLVAGLFAASGTTFLAPAAMAQNSGIGAKGELFGGIARDERPLADSRDAFSGGVLPSVTFGLGSSATVQVDGMAARHIGDTVIAAAGHVGVMPTPGISIGVYGAYAHFDGLGGLDNYRIGGEGSYHGARISLSAVVGYEHSQRRFIAAGTIPGFTVIDDYGRGGSFFSMADISLYPDENWSLTAGHRYIGRQHAAALGTEKHFAGSPVSLFAEGRIGDNGYTAAWAGLRIRFGGGGGTSLQASDQGSGYANRLKDELFTITNTRRRGQEAIVAPPAPPVPGGNGCACGGSYCGQT